MVCGICQAWELCYELEHGSQTVMYSVTVSGTGYPWGVESVLMNREVPPLKLYCLSRCSERDVE